MTSAPKPLESDPTTDFYELLGVSCINPTREDYLVAQILQLKRPNYSIEVFLLFVEVPGVEISPLERTERRNRVSRESCVMDEYDMRSRHIQFKAIPLCCFRRAWLFCGDPMQCPEYVSHGPDIAASKHLFSGILSQRPFLS